MCTARGLQSFNASCACREGRRTTAISLLPNIKPIYPVTTKLNQEVSSSWAYSPYSPRIMCMPKDIKRKGNPKRFKQLYSDFLTTLSD